MPFAVLFLLIATSNEYAAFYRTSAGWLVIGLGGLLCMGGLVTINRLGRLPVEHRILTFSGPAVTIAFTAATVAAGFAVLVTRTIVPPRRPLGGRVLPYAALSRSRLGTGHMDMSVVALTGR